MLSHQERSSNISSAITDDPPICNSILKKLQDLPSTTPSHRILMRVIESSFLFLSGGSSFFLRTSRTDLRFTLTAFKSFRNNIRFYFFIAQDSISIILLKGLNTLSYIF